MRKQGGCLGPWENWAQSMTTATFPGVLSRSWNESNKMSGTRQPKSLPAIR